MTEATISTKRKAVIGDFVIVHYTTDANAATGYTIDTHIDDVAAEGKVILNTFLQNTTGTVVDDCTWSNTTGVITLPTISTGVHKLTVIMG